MCSMLNHLTVLSQEINAAKNSRVYLEETYSELLNNINPNAVDESTLEQLGSMLDTLESYRLIDVQRDRLERVYNERRAAVLKAALPNPISLKSFVDAQYLTKIAATVAYMAADAYLGQEAALSDVTLEWMEGSWELDDAEAETLHLSRKGAFDYMIRIISEQGLPGELALTESAVEEFVNWKNNENVIQRIQFLESNEATYRAFGEYWLVLAKSYYDNGDFAKCLDAVASYEALGIGIFRRDRGLAQTLPLAITAAAQVLQGDAYVEAAERYCDEILANADSDDWALRYFVAQALIDLHARTGDDGDLERAREIALNNVNSLVNLQREMNREYLGDVREAKAPEGATKAQKKAIESYNKQLKRERKTALPPICEPLVLNCDLLFLLSRELDIPESERAVIDGILHGGGEALFLVPSVDALYRFDAPGEAATGEIEVRFDGGALSIPAKYVTDAAEIEVSVTEPDGAPTTFSDWQISEVQRGKGADFDAWVAVFDSPTAKDYQYSEASKVSVTVWPRSGSEIAPLEFTFTAYNDKENWWEQAKLWDDGISFHEG